MKGSLVIILFLLGGALCGYVEVFPQEIVDQGWSAYALGALMFGVGLSIGHNPILLRSFRQIRPILFFLPLATIMGTLCASAFVSLFLPHSSMAQSLAIGSGFGYYSLSSIFITEYRGAETGTIALLSNIIKRGYCTVGGTRFGALFRALGPHCSSRSHLHGHHAAYHCSLLGIRLYHRFYISWFYCGFQRPFPCLLFLFFSLLLVEELK